MSKTFDTTCAVCGVAIRARDKGRGQTLYFCSHACRDTHRRTGVEQPCAVCGAMTYRKLSHAKERVYCSRPCADQHTGENTRAKVARGAARKDWKGGVVMRDGYRFLRLPEHPNANNHGYVAEHRLVMSTRLGRPLRSNEFVHHIDHNPLNNMPDNLLLMKQGAHISLHRKAKLAGTSGWALYREGCLECGTTERKHMARGLCARCYFRLRYQARKHVR